MNRGDDGSSGLSIVINVVSDVMVVVVQLSFESDVLLAMVSVVDKQAIECGRDALKFGEDVSEDEDDFRCRYKRVNAGPVV